MTFGDWRLLAACKSADAGLFFGPDGETVIQRTAREKRAKAICARCPVTADCLGFALITGQEPGVWGGLTEAEFASMAGRPVGAAAARLALERAAGKKSCSRCHRDRPLRYFHVRRNGRYESRCKPCTSDAVQESRARAA